MPAFEHSLQPVSEKRQYERVPTEAQISIRNSTQFTAAAMRTASSLDTPCQLADLSYGGAKLVGSTPLGEPQDRLEMVLPLADGGQLSIFGTIVRTDGSRDEYSAGVRFVRVSVEDQMKLSDILVSLGDDSLDSFKDTPLVPSRKPIHKRPRTTLLH